MALGIGLLDAASSKQTVTLKKKTYTLKFIYNSRFDYWTISIFDSKGDSILLGEKAMPNKELLTRYSLDDVLGGYLSIESFLESRVSRDNFGLNKTHTLVFSTTEEVEEANGTV